nr:aminotransferase class I/II-fold pyridoxal phosphate-dependent enzyme [uncultured Sphaerochaeta sp.]
MDSLFDQITDRRSSLSVKWNKEVIASICGNPEAEPFWVADMDFPVAPEVSRQAQKLAGHAIYGYPYDPRQKEAFLGWAKQWHQMDLSQNQVVLSQGVLNSIAILLDLLSKEKDEIIVPFPSYQPFVTMVNNLGRTLSPWPLSYDEHDHQFSLDWDAFEKLCKTAKILIFCSPHNPSGLVFSEAELTKLCSIAKEHGVTIISDEIHADLRFNSFVSLLEVGKKTGCESIACMAPSKTFNMAGEHYSITLFNNPSLKKAYEKKLQQLFLSGNSTFAMTLATAAYQSGGTWLSELLTYLQDNLAYIEETLQKHVPEIVCIKPKASFITLLDCSALLPLVEKDRDAHPELYDSKKSPGGGLLSRYFGQRAKVAFNDGTWFGGEEYRKFVRINFGTQRIRLEQAMERIIRAVEVLRNTYGS